MPLENYGVLKARPIARRLATHANAHYQVHLIDLHEDTDYRVAINVKSQLSPSELEYLFIDHYQHPMLAELPDLPLGFTPIARQPGGIALDFIRGNLFDPAAMQPLPFDQPGQNNDLNELLDAHMQPALADEEALIYAFGERWGPESQRDKIFGFRPGNGIHDIHMNQGNAERFIPQDGVWQDGALFIHFPVMQRWTAVFLKFQSQCWHTDDIAGHCIATVEEPTLDGIIRIVAALPNPIGGAPEAETVTLLNTSPQAINLTGWAIADRQKHKHSLSGALPAGQTIVIALPSNVQLGNQGGVISLLNPDGLKVDGVSYTREQVQREGWTIIF